MRGSTRLVARTCAALAAAALVGPAAGTRAAGAALQDDFGARQLTDIRKRYKKADDADQRLELLKEAAALGRSAPDAPPPAVAEFLGQALSDDDVGVRRGGLPLLVVGQAPEPVVEALVDGWKQAKKDWKRIDKQLAKHNKDRGGSYKKGLVDAEDAAWYMGGGRYFDLLIVTLGVVHDERTEAVLVDILESKPDELPGRFFVAACLAAQSMGSAAALEAEVECVERLHDALSRGKVRVRYPREGPPILLDAWLASYREVDDEDLKRILDSLAAFARTEGLEPVPAAGDDPGKAWGEWLAAHREALPAEVGRLTVPVESEPAPPGGEVGERDG